MLLFLCHAMRALTHFTSNKNNNERTKQSIEEKLNELEKKKKKASIKQTDFVFRS